MNENEQVKEMESEIVPLTVELAKHYDRMNTLLGERDPDSPKGKNRVGRLHEIYREGNFHTPVWSDCLVTSEKGKKYRIDGGHSSRMLTQLGCDFPDNMFVVIRHFRVADIPDAIKLYEQFNQSISTRTFTDLIRNRMAYVKKIRNLSPTTVTKATRGICSYLKLHNPCQNFNPLDFVELEDNFIKWSAKFTGTGRLGRTAIVAAMYATYLVDKMMADEFWIMVRDASAPEPDNATRTLADFLRDLYADKTSKITFSSHCIFVKCCHAWNAWRQGNKTNLSYFKGCSLPELK